MRETEAKAKRAEYLRGVERLEQLFTKAAEVGISEQRAWAIIVEHETKDDLKPGLLALIAEVQKRERPGSAP